MVTLSDTSMHTVSENEAFFARRRARFNNIIEADHGAFKRVIQPTRGFQTMKTAAATIKGFEVMRMIRRGYCLTCKPHAKDEVRFVNKLFDVYNVAA